MSRSTKRLILASITASVVVLAGVSTPASAAPLAMVLSNSYGPTGGGNTIIGSITPNTGVTAPFPAGSAPVIQFQFFGSGSTSCTAHARAEDDITGTGTATASGVLTVDPNTVTRISSWKVVFEVPDSSYPGNALNPSGLALTGTQTQAKWSVCVYDSTSTTASNLLATSVYTVALRPTITGVTPTSSPAAGGETITVTGTGFQAGATPITASIGGVALTNIKVAANGTSFTATTGPRAAAAGLTLTVVAPGGTVTSNPITFEYTNGITITPDTGVSATEVTIDVTGAGFSQLPFDTVGAADPTGADAHVFLVDGAYNAASNRGLAECHVKVVVSDTQLVCDLDLTAALDPATSALTGGPVPDGAYILTVVATGDPGAGVAANPSIISSGAAFVVAPY